jgi:hypothetical protein
MVRHIIRFSPSGYAVRRQALEKLLFFAYQGPVYSAEGLRPFSLRRASLTIYLEAAIPSRCHASHVHLRLTPFLPTAACSTSGDGQEVDRSIEGSRRAALPNFHSGP